MLPSYSKKSYFFRSSSFFRQLHTDQVYSRHVQFSISHLFPLCAVTFCLCAFSSTCFLVLLRYFIVILSISFYKTALDITHICSSLQHTGTFSSDPHENRRSWHEAAFLGSAEGQGMAFSVAEGVSCLPLQSER